MAGYFLIPPLGLGNSLICLACISISIGAISEALLSAPADASLVNPFRAQNAEDFTMWYFILGVIGMSLINYIAWQGS